MYEFGVLARISFALRIAPRHAAWARRKNEFCAKGQQQNTALEAHRVGHDEDETVSLYSSDKSEAYAGIPAGRLNEYRFAWVDFAGSFGVFNHADADAILHAGERVLTLELCDNFGHATFRDLVKPNHRRVANQFCDVFRDLHVRPLQVVRITDPLIVQESPSAAVPRVGMLRLRPSAVSLRSGYAQHDIAPGGAEHESTISQPGQ
jgi:hypothetical protein